MDSSNNENTLRLSGDWLVVTQLTFSGMSHRRTVPSSAADRNTSLEGWVAKPQIGPSMCPFTKMLHAAFFSPTSIISAFLVPTRILPWQQAQCVKAQMRQNSPDYFTVTPLSYLSSTHRANAVYDLSRFQSKRSAPLQLLVPKL